MLLDEDFGICARGNDILGALRPDGSPHIGAQPRFVRHAAQDGHVALRPGLTYRTESAVELVVYGLSGLEQLDIYVNGFSVLCEAELQLEDRLRPQLLRYSLAPLSCVIRNVVIRVSRCSEEGLDSDPSRFGVVVSKSFGVLVGGHDCLRSAVFVEEGSPTSKVSGLPSGSAQRESMEAGWWLEEGYYVLSAYRRVRKLFDARTPMTTASCDDEHLHTGV